MFVGKVRTITRPGTLVLPERCLSISEANECLTSATMKRRDKVNGNF